MRDSLATSKLGETCNVNIQDATDHMEKLLQDETGWKQLTKMFRYVIMIGKNCAVIFLEWKLWYKSA